MFTVDLLLKVFKDLSNHYLYLYKLAYIMASPASSSISVASQSQTNKELEALPLVDKDGLIGDFEGNRYFL